MIAFKVSSSFELCISCGNEPMTSPEAEASEADAPEAEAAVAVGGAGGSGGQNAGCSEILSG